MLVSHFLLDLQEASQRTVVGLATDDLSGTSQSVGSSIDFAQSALGSIGATIDPVADCGVEEDDPGQSADENRAPAENIGTGEGELGELSRDEDEFEIREVPQARAEEVR